MNKLLRKQLSAVGVGLILATCASIANAGAVATSYLEITNLKILKSTGGDVVLGVDLTQTGSGIRNNADTDANLNGVSDPQTATGIPPSLSGFDVGGPGFSCVGDCAGYVDDSFSYLTSPGDVPGSSYALNDINQVGAAISIGGEATTGSNAFALAESAVTPAGDPGNVGTATGNVELLADFNVTANFTGDVTVTFDWESYLRAFLSLDLQAPPSIASASAGWTMTIRDASFTKFVSRTLDFSNDGFIGALSTGIPGTDIVRNDSGSVSFSTTGNFFIAGAQYNISIAQNVSANSTAVPAPGSLALLSLGLMGLGATLRRRRARG